MRDTKPRNGVARRRRMRRAGLGASALLATLVLFTACAEGSAGPGVAGQASSSTPSASISGEGMFAYSQCMREHGISDFPDPDADGDLQFQPEPGSDLDPASPQFQAAEEACQSLAPPPPSQEQQEQIRDEMLAYARCMREHGFPDFPDPEPGEGFSIPHAEEDPELDPNNPQYEAANEACGGGGS